MATYTLTIEGIVPVARALHVETGTRYVLGRASDADFPLPEGDHRISRYHASVEGTLGGLQIKDLGSSNRTFVNGAQVDDAVLRPGDRVRLGKTVLVVGRMEPGMPGVFGLFRPARDGRCDGMTELEVGSTETSTNRLPCASCGEAWPSGGDAQRAPCPACRPNQPLGPGDPRKLGPFDLLSVIGTGPTSTVYEARHRFTGMRTALRRITSPCGTQEELTTWIEKVRKSAALLHHPKLVRTFEPVWDRETGERGISMGWFRAGNCRKLAGPDSAVAPMLLLGADLFDALAYLHAMGLVHGNVRPDNLLLSRGQGERWCGTLADHTGEAPRAAGAFSAPELLDPSRSPTPGADIYSAAATVYFLLTGCAPAPDRPRAPLSSLRRDLPAQLVELIDGALVPDPAVRGCAPAGDLALRLRRIAESQ